MTSRFVCIHGHFYQPPRANPVLEVVEEQPSATPYHDWNERITDECYRPNGQASLGSDDDSPRNNNYAGMSFNFGPTLLRWLEANAADVYGFILAADEESQGRFSGHGSAMAQSYHHSILPLLDARDRRTEVVWGKRDFEARFGRPPEGMWLPETAVDLESLDLLAEHGMKFALLAPSQAQRVRVLEGGEWEDVSEEKIDPHIPYQVNLPSGRELSLFFYDGPLSRSLAFEDLLEDGVDFANRMLATLPDEAADPLLAHVATDGESYGHHHKFGEMALAWAEKTVRDLGSASLTNFGEFLERRSAAHEVEIWENSSWSCGHGVERWKSDCGCHVDGGSQAWRAPLRESLDFLRDAIRPLFEERASDFLRDPWSARDDYVELVIDRSTEARESFLKRHVTREISIGETAEILELLEMQRNTLAMYTSCGWFFDDLGGIETVQNLRHAGRALQLASRRFGPGLEEPFLERLEKARSNYEAVGTGKEIFESQVRPALLGPEELAFRRVQSLFADSESPPSLAKVFEFSVGDLRYSKRGADEEGKLCLGRITVQSRRTLSEDEFSFAAIRLRGEGDLIGLSRVSNRSEDADEAEVELIRVFEAGEDPEAKELILSRLSSAGHRLEMKG